MFDKSMNYFNTKDQQCVGDIKALKLINYAKNSLLNYASYNDIHKILAIYELELGDEPFEWFHHISKNQIIRLQKFCKRIVYNMKDCDIDNAINDFLNDMPITERYFMNFNINNKYKNLIQILKN